MSNSHYSAWLTLLQPTRYLVALQTSGGPVQGFQRVGPPVGTSVDYLAIAALLHEHASVFTDPEFPPAYRVTHNTDLIDNTTKLLKLKQCYFSPAE